MTRYAKSGDVHIGYQVVGDGSLDVVVIPPFVSHLDVFWEDSDVSRFFDRLASFSRLILFDKRGTGLSDRTSIASLEERMDDVRAVMHDAGSEAAALVGFSEGAAMSALFAATYPERTRALILCGASLRLMRSPDFPWARNAEEIAALREAVSEVWGQGTAAISLFAPSVASDPRKREWGARLERQAASPGAVLTLIDMNQQIDVRPVLPTIRVPTLVVHQTGDLVVDVEQGRYLAQHIAGAKLVEFDGVDHLPWFSRGAAILDEIEEFLTGERHRPVPDRTLSTVLFTDIVGSTERASNLGDRRWRALLDEHDRAVREDLERYRGKEVKTTGDGFLAMFDGPARAVTCGCAIRDTATRLGLEVRVGVHTGEIELRGDDIGGIAVHIGQRIQSLASPGEVLASRTVTDLVAGSAIEFEDRGDHALKGITGTWNLFAAKTP